MNEKNLEARVRELETQVTAARDVEEIERLQRIYGFFLDNRRWDDIVDLFSEHAESLEISDSGVYLGKEGATRFFKGFLGRGGLPPGAGALGLHMQLQGVVHVDEGGATARGRWQCLMLLAVPRNGELTAMLGHGVYDMGYIKEDGVWQFSKLHFYLTFRTPLDQGWVKVPVVHSMAAGTPDKPSTVYKPLPESYIVPFAFTHPVTGKDIRV